MSVFFMPKKKGQRPVEGNSDLGKGALGEEAEVGQEILREFDEAFEPEDGVEGFSGPVPEYADCLVERGLGFR